MRGKKNRRRLAKRINSWREINTLAMHGTRTKLVRRPDGKGSTAFHQPGSQNGRK